MELCIALDLPSLKENLKLVKLIKNENIWLKVGLRSFVRDGKPLLEEIKSITPKHKIFLDLKIYDIPNTMADTAESMTGIGVDMFNIHASSGKKAMGIVMERLENLKNAPKVLAVTALTSFNETIFRSIYGSKLEIKVLQFAKDAYESGLDGVVCSAFESKAVKSNVSSEFLTLTPGIRPFNEIKNDQHRVASLSTAKEGMSDFIVIGRPIYNSNDPLGVVKKVLKNI